MSESLLCPLHAAAPALLEALHDTTEALENCLARFGQYMTDGDRHGRGKVVLAARALLDALRPDEPHEDDEEEA